MNYTTKPARWDESRPEAHLLGRGCKGCWAAGCCAGFAPNSRQIPAACPLLPEPEPQRRRAN